MTLGRAQLREIPIDQQINYLHNAFRCLHPSGNRLRSEALQLLDDLEGAWRDKRHERQNEEFRVNGLIPVDTPERGVLRTMGYRVGAAHLEEWLRRDILMWVLNREIPYVHSCGYMRQWGLPSSKMRTHKLNSVLTGFIEASSGRASHTQAVKHWSKDRSFILQNGGDNAAAK